MQAMDALTVSFEHAGYHIPDGFKTILQDYLQQTDDHALESVRRNIGGPFGARFVIVTKDGLVHPVGQNVGNAVVSSGIASRHAESENWTQNWDALVEKLEDLKGQEKTLIELSSGESCINCHTKQELGFEKLRKMGLLSDNDGSEVVFGASYRQTADVAGFNDLVYLIALQKIKGFELDAGDHNPLHEADIDEGKKLSEMYSHTKQSIEKIPEDVAKIFQESDKPVVVVVREGKVFSIGHDEREDHFTRTPEVVALQNACINYRQQLRNEFELARKEVPEVLESWDLGGDKKDVKVYTSTAEIGPAMLSEGYWSNALSFVTVEHDQQKEWATRESLQVSNDELLTTVALHLHNKNDSTVHVHHSPTENKAQTFWRDKDDAINYDGAKAEDDDLSAQP